MWISRFRFHFRSLVHATAFKGYDRSNRHIELRECTFPRLKKGCYGKHLVMFSCVEYYEPFVRLFGFAFIWAISQENTRALRPPDDHNDDHVHNVHNCSKLAIALAQNANVHGTSTSSTSAILIAPTTDPSRSTSGSQNQLPAGKTLP